MAPQNQPSQLSGLCTSLVTPIRFQKRLKAAEVVAEVAPLVVRAVGDADGARAHGLGALDLLATMSRASSQLMRTNSDLPRFWMLRSPSGSKSTRFIGCRMRFFEYTMDFWHMACAAAVVLRGGVNVLPRA
jgi:hypothetical protein